MRGLPKSEKGLAGGPGTTRGHLLSRLGIDVGPYRALLNAFLLMDLRNQPFARVTYSRPKDLFSALFWVTGQNLLISVFLSLVMFARVEATVFVLVALTVSMLVVATSIIVEFNEVVLDPTDLETIGHQPVKMRTYSAARLTNLLIYVVYVTISLNVVPSIVGLGLLETNWLFFPTYWLATIAGNLTVAGSVIVLYAWLSNARPGHGVQETLAWTQALLMLITGYGGQAVLRDSHNRLEMVAYTIPQWAGYVPMWWLAEFVGSSGGGWAATRWWIIAAWMPLLVGVWGAALWTLSKTYARVQPGRTAWRRLRSHELPRPGELGGRLTRWITRPHEERTAFWICTTMLRRDHNLRMRSWPTLGMVVGFLAIGVFIDRLDDPLASSGRGAMIALAAIYLAALPVPTIIHNLTFSRDHQAAWILAVAPIVDRTSFASGLRKAVTINVLLPIWVLMVVLFAIRWSDPLHVVLHAIVGWMVILGAGYACQMGIMRRLPFSAPLGRGESLGSIAPFSAAVTGSAFTLAAVHFATADAGIGPFMVYAFLLGGLVLFLRRQAMRVSLRRYARGTLDA